MVCPNTGKYDVLKPPSLTEVNYMGHRMLIHVLRHCPLSEHFGESLQTFSILTMEEVEARELVLQIARHSPVNYSIIAQNSDRSSSGEESGSQISEEERHQGLVDDAEQNIKQRSFVIDDEEVKQPPMPALLDMVNEAVAESNPGDIIERLIAEDMQSDESIVCLDNSIMLQKGAAANPPRSFDIDCPEDAVNFLTKHDILIKLQGAR